MLHIGGRVVSFLSTVCSANSLAFPELCKKRLIHIIPRFADVKSLLEISLPLVKQFVRFNAWLPLDNPLRYFLVLLRHLHQFVPPDFLVKRSVVFGDCVVPRDVVHLQQLPLVDGGQVLEEHFIVLLHRIFFKIRAGQH